MLDLMLKFGDDFFNLQKLTKLMYILFFDSLILHNHDMLSLHQIAFLTINYKLLIVHLPKNLVIEILIFQITQGNLISI